MSLFNWSKGKSRSSDPHARNIAPSKTENAQPQYQNDPQQKLWIAESSSEMRSLIATVTEPALSDLVNSIAFADFPLNGLASAGGSLDKRSILTVHFILQLLKTGKNSHANQLINKVLDKMRAKLATGSLEGGALLQDEQKRFESAFATGEMGSAIGILKQNRSVDFWRIDEALKREIYDLAMEMLKINRHMEAAILLDAVMLDYPYDLDTEFWRVAAYHNIFNRNKADSQAKHDAKQAICSFLHKAEGNRAYGQKCNELRKLITEQYGESSPAKGKPPDPDVQELTFSTSEPLLAMALFVKYVNEHGCACGGKWENQTGDMFQCEKCGAKKVFRMSYR